MLWGGLLTTLSQSSFAALLLGLAVLAWLRFGAQVVIAPALVAVAAAAVLVFAFPGALRLDLGDSESLDNATSGRVELMAAACELAREQPLPAGARAASAPSTAAHETRPGARRRRPRTRSRSRSPPSRA